MSLDRIEQQELQTSIFPHDAVQYTQPHATTPTVEFKSAWTLSTGTFHATTANVSTAHLGAVHATSLSAPLISTGQLVATSVGDITLGGNQVLTWVEIDDPTVGWLASKTSGWTANNFSAGLTVDFSSDTPAGAVAVQVAMNIATDGGIVWARKGGNTDVANDPSSDEHAARALQAAAATTVCVVLPLSANRTTDIAVGDTAIDLYLSYPQRYLT